MLTSIVLGYFVGWTLGLFVLTLMRKAGDEDQAAAHEEKLLHPFSDAPITQYGTGRIAVGLGSHPAA